MRRHLVFKFARFVVSGEASDTHKFGTANGGIDLYLLVSVLDSTVSKRAKLELRILSGGGFTLAGDGKGELVADETGDGCVESDSTSIWIVDGTAIEML